MLVPGLFLFEGLASAGISGWLTLLWVLVLGLLATLPVGMLLGGLVSNPRVVGQGLFLVSGALIAISGIFYPISALPGLLPDAAAAVELSGSWQHLETVGVLRAWAVVGLILAPVVLRRMAVTNPEPV